MDETDLEIARLVDRLLRRIHGGLHARADAFDIYAVGQAGGLLLLTIAEMQPVHAQDLSRALARDKSQLARMIASLDGKGLISRTKDTADARISYLKLTDDGQIAVDRIRHATAEVISSILEPLCEPDRQRLRALLARV